MRLFYIVSALLLTCDLFSLRAANEVYAAEFNQGNNRFGPINLYTGTFTQIGTYGGTVINDIAYDALTQSIYGIENSTSLVTFNLQTGAISTVGNFSAGGIETLAFQPDTGVLFAASQNNLYTVDILTGQATSLGGFGTPTGLNNNGQNIRFASDGDLYDTNTSTNGTSTGLYRLDLTSGSATYLGDAQGYDNLVLANAGDQMFGVSVNVTGSDSQPVLIAFDLNSLGDGSSPHDISVQPLDGQSNILPNFNFSGDQSAAPIKATPEPSTSALIILGMALLLLGGKRFQRLLNLWSFGPSQA